MALTVNEVVSTFSKHDGASGLYGSGKTAGCIKAKITFDSSYPTGGEALAVSDFSSAPSAATLAEVFFLGGEDNATANTPSWDRSEGKIIMTVASTGSEVADTTNLSTNIIFVEAIFT